MSFDAEKFSELVKMNGLTNKDIVERFKNDYGKDITIDTIKSYRRKNGKNAEPSNENLLILAKILNTTTDVLLGNDDEKKPIRTVPLIGTASCGSLDGNHLDDIGEFCYISTERWNPNLYAVRANGDSMAPEIEDGDEIVCDPEAEVQNGDIVHYRIGSESAIKVYYKDEDAYILQFIPYNSNEHFKTKTIRLDDDDAREVKISKVVEVHKTKFNNRAARLRLIGR